MEQGRAAAKVGRRQKARAFHCFNRHGFIIARGPAKGKRALAKVLDIVRTLALPQLGLMVYNRKQAKELE